MRTASPILSRLALIVACAGAAAAEDSANEVNKLITQHHYADAAAMAQRMLDAHPQDQDAAYNLACALARQGKGSAALDALAKSAELGYADSDHVKVDDDLVSLHGKTRFETIVGDMQKKAEAAHAKDMQGIPVEAGAAIDGVKTVEGDPASGLRWRLRVAPDADAKAPRCAGGLAPSLGRLHGRPCRAPGEGPRRARLRAAGIHPEAVQQLDSA